MPPSTTTEQTVISYLYNAGLLERRARRELRLAPTEDLRCKDLVTWAITLRPALSASSWRQYKSALRCSIERQKGVGANEALTLLESADTGPCQSITRNTSAQKARKLSPADFNAIRDYLLKKKWKWARATVIWLAAGYLTGLRPTEWLGAKLIQSPDGRIMLRVENAKATNQRAHGPSRTLDLGDIQPAMLASLRRQLAFVAKCSSPESFRNSYIACMKTLYRATRKLWPTRTLYPCLYSARHQFCADGKAAGWSRTEIAAMMGHASDFTAARHYGRRTSGRAGFSVRPVPSDVARVRQVAVSRSDHIARKAKRATATPSSRPTR